MRVLRVIASMDPRSGGPCQGIRHSVPAMAKYGHSTEVISLDRPDADFLAACSFPAFSVGKGQGPWGYSSAFLPWLYANFANFDAVVVHGLWLYSSFAVWKVSNSLRRAGYQCPPYFVMPHGMLDPWFQRARPVKALRNTLYWRLIEHKVIEGARGVLFTCDEEMRLAREPFRPYRPACERVVGYGIPQPPQCGDRLATRFRERFPQIGHRKFFVFVGRIHDKKGVDLLLRAYALVTQSLHGGANTLEQGKSELPILVIAGPCADRGYFERLKSLASSLALHQCDVKEHSSTQSSIDTVVRPSVVWLPMLTGEDKWGAFYASEAFVLPSHQENFGIAIVEAMACGRAVLISNKVNIWREIERDQAGLIGDDDLAGTADVLARWLRLSEREKKEMQYAAKRSFEIRFEIDRAAQSLVSVLGELV